MKKITSIVLVSLAFALPARADDASSATSNLELSEDTAVCTEESASAPALNSHVDEEMAERSAICSLESTESAVACTEVSSTQAIASQFDESTSVTSNLESTIEKEVTRAAELFDAGDTQSLGSQLDEYAVAADHIPVIEPAWRAWLTTMGARMYIALLTAKDKTEDWYRVVRTWFLLQWRKMVAARIALQAAH